MRAHGRQAARSFWSASLFIAEFFGVGVGEVDIDIDIGIDIDIDIDNFER